MMWKNKLKADPSKWLLDSDPWTRYKVITDLLDRSPDCGAAIQAKKELFQHELIQKLINETGEWFPAAIGRHNDAKLTHYKLRMLADFGININDPGIEKIINTVISHEESGMYAIRQQLPEKSYIKADPKADEWHAQPCDSPLITYCLKEMGWEDKKLDRNIKLIRDKWNNTEGWFCFFFFVEGQYKKLKIGCPMAGMMALEVFSTIAELKESIYAQNAFAPLKFHYEHRKSVYYFGRSKKFWTTKYPFIWYNALYMADVLSHFDFCKNEPMVIELIEWIINQQDEQGRYTPTSMFQAYKGWDFSNKKEPSPWITYLCCRILKRYFG